MNSENQLVQTPASGIHSKTGPFLSDVNWKQDISDTSLLKTLNFVFDIICSTPWQPKSAACWVSDFCAQVFVQTRYQINYSFAFYESATIITNFIISASSSTLNSGFGSINHRTTIRGVQWLCDSAQVPKSLCKLDIKSTIPLLFMSRRLS